MLKNYIKYKKMKILLFGASGCLGTELKKINPDIICPTREECNIIDYNEVYDTIIKYSPDVIIHAAAVTDNRMVEKHPMDAIHVNVIGTANIAMECINRNIRLVYLSTDYLYKGNRGNYLEEDEILPFNLYSWTKLGGECSVKGVPNHLIIRTSFGKNTFDYKEAFTDKWSSKDYVDVIAPMIYEASLSPLTGVLNMGTERKTLHSHAIERSPDVKPVKIADTNYFTPYDTSLNLQKWMNYKTSSSIAHPHTECRVCGSSNLSKYLDLGLMPLANNLEFTAQLAKNKERFPLQVMFCKDCGLSQLSVVINPEKMFSYYTYRSSVNKGYVDHCKTMALDMSAKGYVGKSSFHIDIAGNDGTLLKVFKDVLGHRVLNIDPASNLTAISEAIDIPCITDFWGMHLVNEIEKADLITATNVFAHLDDVREFIQACKETLKPDGVLIIENPYLVDFIENNEFDTIYFEHVTYWSITPMIKLCESIGLKLIDAEKQLIHGGTMRYTIAKSDSKHKVSTAVRELFFQEQNKKYDKFSTYSKWSDDVRNIIDNFATNLLELKKQGNTIIGFAASAKGNTLLNAAGINTDVVECIIDQTPEKIGKFSPGTGIPIYGIEKIMKISPDYIIILSWNFKEEIIAKIKALGYKGKYIIPIPEWEVI